MKVTTYLKEKSSVQFVVGPSSDLVLVMQVLVLDSKKVRTLDNQV